MANTYNSIAFLFYCRAPESKTLADFVMEARDIIIEYLKRNSVSKDSNKSYKNSNILDYELIYQQLLEDAKDLDVHFGGLQYKILLFSKRDETMLGKIFYYMLRREGMTTSFAWEPFQLL